MPSGHGNYTTWWGALQPKISSICYERILSRTAQWRQKTLISPKKYLDPTSGPWRARQHDASHNASRRTSWRFPRNWLKNTKIYVYVLTLCTWTECRCSQALIRAFDTELSSTWTAEQMMNCTGHLMQCSDFTTRPVSGFQRSVATVNLNPLWIQYPMIWMPRWTILLRKNMCQKPNGTTVLLVNESAPCSTTCHTKPSLRLCCDT